MDICFQIITTVAKPARLWKERTDFIDVSRLGPLSYFAEYENWAEHQRLAMKYATGRVLDIGCGAGTALPLSSEAGTCLFWEPTIRH